MAASAHLIRQTNEIALSSKLYGCRPTTLIKNNVACQKKTYQTTIPGELESMLD